MKVFVLAVVFVTSAVAEAQPVSDGSRKVVSLADALRMAVANNHDYQGALAQASITRAQVNRVWGAVLPEVTVGGSAVHTSAPARFDMGQLVGLVGQVYALRPVRPELTPPATDLVAENSLYMQLQLQQVLFSPHILLIPAAKPGIQAAKLGAQEAREQILLAVARLYLGVQGLMQMEGAAKDAEAVALKREKDVLGQVAAGTQSDIALLRAQTETAAARGTLAQLAGQREGLLAVLASLVGGSIAPEPTVHGLPNSKPANETDEPWERVFMVRASEKAIAAQEPFVTYDKFQFLPTLLAQAKGQYNSNKGFVGTNWVYDFSLMVSVPLFDRGNRSYQRAEDEAKLHVMREKLLSDRAKAKANWITAKANLAAAEAALAQAEAQAALAAKAQKQLDAAFQLGLATELELSDIDNKRFFAASQVAQVRASLEVRKVEMLAAEGRLAHEVGFDD